MDLEEELFGDLYEEDDSGVAAAQCYLSDVDNDEDNDIHAEIETNVQVADLKTDINVLAHTGVNEAPTHLQQIPNHSLIIENKIAQGIGQNFKSLRNSALAQSQQVNKNRQMQRNAQVDELVAIKIAKSIILKEKEADALALKFGESPFGLGYLLSLVEYLKPNDIWNFQLAARIQNSLTTTSEKRNGAVENFSNMPLEEEVKIRFEQLNGSEFNFDSLIHVYLPEGRDPLFKVQMLDQEFRNALRHHKETDARSENGNITSDAEENRKAVYVVEEEIVVGYLNMVLSNNRDSDSCLTKRVIDSIPHIDYRKNPNVHFTLHRFGTAVSKTIERLRLLKGNRCTTEDLIRYVKTSQRVLLRAVLIIYPELFYAKANPKTKSLYILHERMLYTIAVVLEKNFLKEVFTKEMGIVRMFSDRVAEEDAQIAKNCVQIVHTLSDEKIKSMLHLHQRLSTVDFSQVIRSLKLMETIATPFSKMEQVVHANRLIPLCVSSHFGSDSQGSCIGADDFLPIFVFCLLHALPTHLQSSIETVNSFTDSFLQSGECGYALTTCKYITFV
uniref:VPS9 domain-containing protein n=1 Tax=Aplanochytrium stocchinoi TaxID=215587 RepID=A0A6S8DWC3_9STRA